MTASDGMVTGGVAAVPASRSGGSAERMRRKRERDRAARAAAQQLLASDVERQAAARQVGLPLPGVVEQEELGSRGAGRPAGSVARRTEDWQRFMLGQYRSPLVVLAETFTRPTGQLARELGCTHAEAFAFQMQAARELAPYLHSKMPQAVRLDGAPLVGVQVAVSPDFARAIEADAGGGIALPVIEGNQGVGHDAEG